MPGFEAGPNFKGDDEAKELASMEIHNTGLHDQDEDAAGEKVDLATGEKYDNSTYTGTEHLQVVEDRHESEDALGAIPEEKSNVPAELDPENWLKDNDPDYKKAA